jgi:hypothetical protein
MQEEGAVDTPPPPFFCCHALHSTNIKLCYFYEGQRGTNEYGVEMNILTVDSSVTSR